MKPLSFLVRACIVFVLLTISQSAWRIYYLVNIPTLDEKRYLAGLPPNMTSGYLIDFVIVWQKHFWFWTGMALLSVVLMAFTTFKSNSSKLNRSKYVFIIFCVLVGIGTIALFAASALMAIGLEKSQ